MPFAKKTYKNFSKNSHKSFILAGDVGGTNTNLGIFGIKDKVDILVSYHFKSKELNGLFEAINETLDNFQENYKIEINKACIAIAGLLSPQKDYAKVTNAKWNVSKSELFRKTNLRKIFLLNDFEAIGYGINILPKKDTLAIKKAKKIPKAPIVVIGSGTGLGKTTLIYDEHHKSHIPISSEAGHSDFSVQNQFELDLINFIKRNEKIKGPISYEEVLSGRGLTNIYLFLRKSEKFSKTKYTNEIEKSKYNPEFISKYKKIDKTCIETFKIFKSIYARFARNFALDALAFGGIYIGGGIAPKNKSIFDKSFVKIFEDNHKMRDVLKKIPIYLILNYNVGLYGAGFAGAKVLK